MEILSHVNSFLLFTFTGYLLLGGLELSGLRVVLDDRKTGACTYM